MAKPVANPISSRARWFVGSETLRKSRLPRWKIRQGAVLTHQLFIDQVQGEIGKLDGIQIQHGHPELIGGGKGKLSAVQMCLCDHILDERLSAFECLPMRLPCLLFREQPVAYQTPRETGRLEGRLIGRHECLPARHEKRGRYAEDFSKNKRNDKLWA